MKVKSFAVLLVGLVVLITDNQVVVGQQKASEAYTWKSVQMVGGGFVDGIVFHPTAKGVRYARTDMGGAYRWNPQTRRWEPLLDWVSYEDSNLMGVESIALDASDSNRVYLACGTYTNANTPDGAMGEGIAIDAAGNVYTAEATLRGVTKYVKQ